MNPQGSPLPSLYLCLFIPRKKIAGRFLCQDSLAKPELGFQGKSLLGIRISFSVLMQRKRVVVPFFVFILILGKRS